MIFNDAEVVVIDDIRKIPKINTKNYSLPNAEPIVRCRDCKYWSPTTVESLKDGSYINQPNPCEINCFGNKGEWRTAIDFCSKGEKK